MTDLALRERVSKGLMRALGAAVLLVASAAGCGPAPEVSAPIPLETALGPCTLTVIALENDQQRALTPPYRMRWGTEQERQLHEWGLMFGGTGWRSPDFAVQPASGPVQSMNLQGPNMLDADTVFPVDQPGPWRVRISDPMAGCSRELFVEVIP